jgi:RHH-type rel operon transcriptional repressor/antitoxin RelB
LRRKSENRSQVIAVRVEPAIEQRLRLLAEVTGRSQSFFLKKLIEKGIDAMEGLCQVDGCGLPFWLKRSYPY